MTLTTVIPGDPAELTVVATWLRGSLGGALDGSELTLQSARQDDGGWDGTAGDAFRTRMSTAYTHAANLNDALVTATTAIDTFALALTTAQSDAAAVREAAAAAGLTLTTTGIRAPAIWPIPAPPPPGSSAASAQSYYLAQDARSDNVAHWQAYAAASVELARITRTLAGAAEALDDVRADVEVVKVPVASLLSTALVDGVAGTTAPLVAGPAGRLLTAAATIESNTRLPGASLHPRLFYKDLDDASRLRARADALPDRSSTVLKTGRAVSVGVGVAFAGVSVWMDLRAGESKTQATVSNFAGLTASIAAGGLVGGGIGTLIPVPVVGTVVGYGVGALTGAVVGIYTSGFVDSLFENGPDVGAALAQGWQDLQDTGSAAVSLGRAGVEATLDGADRALDWAADGLSDAYDWAFG